VSVEKTSAKGGTKENLRHGRISMNISYSHAFESFSLYRTHEKYIKEPEAKKRNALKSLRKSAEL